MLSKQFDVTASVPCRWISVLNNAKEEVLMKAFGESNDKESSPVNQNMKELSRAVIEQVRLLPGNDHCCDCGAPGELLSFHLTRVINQFRSFRLETCVFSVFLLWQIRSGCRSTWGCSSVSSVAVCIVTWACTSRARSPSSLTQSARLN